MHEPMLIECALGDRLEPKTRHELIQVAYTHAVRWLRVTTTVARVGTAAYVGPTSISLITVIVN